MTTVKKNKTVEKKPPERRYLQVTRREYEGYKRRTVNFERSNRRFIVVLPCDGNQGWYEVGERSALFYKYIVCDKLGLDASLKSDFESFYNQFEIGRVRMRGVEVVRERLKRAEMYKDEEARDKCVIFEMNRTLDETEIEELLEREARRQAELNSIVKVKMSDPMLLTKMLEVSNRLHVVCQKRMDKISRDTNGVRIVAACDKMIMAYYRMSEAEDTSAEAKLEMWLELRRYVHELLIELQIIVGLGIWKRSKCVKIGEMVCELEDRLDTHIRKATQEVKRRAALEAKKVAATQEDKEIKGEKNGTSQPKSTSSRNKQSRAKTVATDSVN